MELRCPECNSPNVSINYVCPHCSSSIIQRTVLLEHYDCGYLGTATSFGEPLVCPKCGARVGEGDYRDAGSIYECADCKRQIETPFAGHRCRECGFKFSFENAVYLPKYAYFPAELTKKEMASGILYLSQVVDVFKELGLKRDVNARAAGKSGVEHAFDAAFTGFGAKFYVDLFFSLDPTGEQDVLREYGKVRDVNANIYLIVLPGLDDEATVLAKSYNMNTVEGENPEKALSKLKVALTEKLAELKQAPAKGKVVKREKAKRRRLFGR
jgi:DNA-directed RNA polymerase subunit RPC12/RpoP